MQLEFPAGSVVHEVHYLEFKNEKAADEAAEIIRQSAQSGSTGPIILPEGQILPWTNGLMWWIEQLTRISMIIMAIQNPLFPHEKP